MVRKLISKFLLTLLFVFCFTALIPITYFSVAKAEGNAEQGNEIIPVERVVFENVEVENDKYQKKLKVGESFELKIKVQPENAVYEEVIWSSSNEKVAVVDNNGKVIAKTIGELTIKVTVKSKINEEIKEVTAECKIIVEPINVSGVILTETKKKVKIGETFNLTAKVFPENATNKGVKWDIKDKDKNKNVVLVDNNGKVTAVGIGTAKIIVTTLDGGFKAECEVEVIPLNLQDIEKRIVSSIPTATIKLDTNIYTSSVKGKVKTKVLKGTKVIILDNKEEWYLIKLQNGIVGWIKKSYLIINPSPILKDTLRKEDLELYVNSKNFKSKTNYFVWVDIARQRTYVFMKDKKGKYNLIKDFVVATGKDATPTIIGLFELDGQRGTWKYFPQYKVGVKNWIRLKGGYLFHSILFAKDGKTILNPNVGKKLSHGCIRMKVDDSYWFYKNIPSKTTVWVN
ncbi:Ig-like domain-containing protein [Thermobrachium celere]|uniref:L,D-TPase catalytic domain-containing protein n=1 Tax=Thermobrachium celere DSM 8682 TaxID=941824 RepID=R7RUF4_9CLOT|nr:Ig-like domain-containing protein [Thermobrachium celere]CDF59013.1 conserved hypothetical protein [Thermobrachium celere DSM 8682]